MPEPPQFVSPRCKMILVAKKKTLWMIVLVVVLLILAATGATIAVLAAPPQKPIVVLDPGHGGIDGGVSGVNSKVKESEINLMISQSVKKLLEDQGIVTVLTRETADGLYPEGSTQTKRDDMEKRKQIIRDAAPSLVVSIHCNKFPDGSRRGAQAFFHPMSESSKRLATYLQTNLNAVNQSTAGKTFAPLKGDYYILNCSSYPSAIVECGFLSNPDDDALLNTEAHRERIAYAVFSSIVTFLTTAS